MARCGSRAAVLVVLAGLSCARRTPTATSYAVNTVIPLGQVTVEVRSLSRAILSSPLEAAPEDRAYAVRVSCAGVPSVRDVRDRMEYLQNFLERQLSLVDSDGDRYRPTHAETEAMYRFAFDRTSMPSFDDGNWVVTFVTPEVSRDFTLLLRNPEPRKDQPALASVHLGMPPDR